MSEKKSIWGKADSFLSLTRKIIVNGATALVLVVLTFSILGGVGSAFSGSDKVESKDKITIVLETFMQNLAVVLIVVMTVFSEVEKFLPYMIIWLFLQNLVGYIIYFMRKQFS